MSSSLENTDWSRRDYLRLFACGASAAALSQFPSAVQAATLPAEQGRLTLAQCQQLSPLDMAKSSQTAVAAYQFLQKSAEEIENPGLRQAVSQILQNPVPTVLARYRSDADKERVRQQLIDAHLLGVDVGIHQLFPPAKGADQTPQPFLSAPGSGYTSHHAYPGGLSVHVALNVRSSLGLYAGYGGTFGLKLSRDVVLASQLLHDLHKPWVFQWKEDGGLLPEYTVAGTGDHHILSLAESIYRGLPAEVIVAQASAHDHPGSPADEAKTVGYLKAGAMIAGKDPIEIGLLGPDGNTVVLPRRIEGFITHIGDHDWIIAGPANTWSTPLLEEIAMQDYAMTKADIGTAKFNAFRNYVFSQTTMIGLHQLHCAAGKEGVRATVNALVAPV
ncbi:hypothetical protein [Telmatospirillum sp.]|uniref:hypothetical protein n=1 Tax=Telmatospirillum sp. TaxID=2079197 RepID=UPI00283B3258|nr:hypothetical protein [Telmatospirillum sp.]MDR3439573.1 hypothetical protein [Telmatospirillum sp.]